MNTDALAFEYLLDLAVSLSDRPNERDRTALILAAGDLRELGHGCGEPSAMRTPVRPTRRLRAALCVAA